MWLTVVHELEKRPPTTTSGTIGTIYVFLESVYYCEPLLFTNIPTLYA